MAEHGRALRIPNLPEYGSLHEVGRCPVLFSDFSFVTTMTIIMKM